MACGDGTTGELELACVEVGGGLVELLELAVRAGDAGVLRSLERELGLLVGRHARHDLLLDAAVGAGDRRLLEHAEAQPDRARSSAGQTRGEIGGFGGGWLERPRRWLGTQWPGLTLRVLSCPDQSHTLRRHRAELGHC